MHNVLRVVELEAEPFIESQRRCVRDLCADFHALEWSAMASSEGDHCLPKTAPSRPFVHRYQVDDQIRFDPQQLQKARDASALARYHHPGAPLPAKEVARPLALDGPGSR